MKTFFLSTIAYLIASGVGLLLASIFLSDFRIDPLSFFVAVLIFSVAQSVLGPLINKLAQKNVPQLAGGIALITVFFALLLTDLIMAGMESGGLANLLVATLLVWLGSLIAAILLPRFVFKQLAHKKPSK